MQTNAAIVRFVRKGELSRHAARRSQQRAITAESIPLLRAYGDREFDGNGGVRYTMTANAIARLRRVIGFAQKLDHLSGCYIVVSADDETRVITIGHRR